MDKKIAGFASAISSLALMHAADASPTQNVREIVTPRSYAELLQPIPNAVSVLKEIDAADAARAEAQAKRNPNVRLAQYWDYGYPHHHHHHHARCFRCLFQKVVHEPPCGDSISLTLHENVYNEASCSTARQRQWFLREVVI